MNKTCPECGDKILGRVDKKFCSDQCRNTYNNKLNSDTTSYVRNVNNILRRNRRILEEFNIAPGKTLVKRDVLLGKGFSFNYHTHTYTTKKGSVYKFCYEQGYLFLNDKEAFLLVLDKMNDVQ